MLETGRFVVAFSAMKRRNGVRIELTVVEQSDFYAWVLVCRYDYEWAQWTQTVDNKRAGPIVEKALVTNEGEQNFWSMKESMDT